MAPEQKKRSRASIKGGQSSRKRQRIEPPKNGTVQKRPVAADALPWNEVEMPEMFDDSEGFFGLEEIEGVDVIREGDSVKFVSKIGRLEISTNYHDTVIYYRPAPGV